MAAWIKTSVDPGYVNLDAVAEFRVIQQGTWTVSIVLTNGGTTAFETGFASESDAFSRIEEIILGNG